MVFNVAVDAMTRVNEEGPLLDKDESFGVWAYLVEEGKNDEALEGAEEFMADAKAVYESGQMWKPEMSVNWPGKDQEMLFYAYMPYSEADFNRQDGIVFEDYDISRGLELYYSMPEASLNSEDSQGIVPISFAPALSRIEIKFINSLTSDETILLKSLEIRNIARKGDFRLLPNPSWSVIDSERVNIKFFDGEMLISDGVATVGDGMDMIPQSADVAFVVKCDIISHDAILPKQELKVEKYIRLGVGKVSSYTLKISGELELTIEKS